MHNAILSIKRWLNTVWNLSRFCLPYGRKGWTQVTIGASTPAPGQTAPALRSHPDLCDAYQTSFTYPTPMSAPKSTSFPQPTRLQALKRAVCVNRFIETDHLYIVHVNHFIESYQINPVYFYRTIQANRINIVYLTQLVESGQIYTVNISHFI